MKKLLLFALSSAAIFAATPCESLTALQLANTTITSAKMVGAGEFTLPSPGRGANPNAAFQKLPAFCRVMATLKPAPDSDIKMEVWLPAAAAWNGKLESVGNGAWAGVISYPALATALGMGYVAASTDTGHVGNNPDFIPGHPDKLADFIHRGVHEMTVAAKGVINGHYGNAPKYSYWNGCSTGGRQALTEAQRYPNDYDGIIAGAAAAYVTRLQGMQVWVSQQAHRDPAAFIPAEKFSVLHDAVMAACDAKDGVKDGVIEDPTKCSFDPKVVACKEGDGPNCLNAAQVETARMMYAGPSINGKNIFPGVEPGSETGFNMLAGPRVMSLAAEMYKYAAFNGNWDMKDFTLADVERFEKEKGPAVNSVDPNLKSFIEHKGKLLMYHGWADPGVPPMGSVNYYNNVAKTVGAPAKDATRLFMVPGMGHCGGGDGTSTFDMIKALEQWVEQGKAPERIEASRVRNGVTDRTRPLCAYPQVAVYKGSGSTDDSANFVCGVR
jgi:pimeloyl-ACP methyl ester carboxylesterase